MTGQSVVRHLLREGVEPVVVDTRPGRATEFPNVEFLFATQRWPQLAVDYAVVSPGLSLDSDLVAGAVAAGVPLKSDIDLFFETVEAPVVGVTGTNGKSTVTCMVGHLLNSSGRSCGVGGNLGEAALDVIEPTHDCYVLELSSFQLERSRTHAYGAAAILNVSEDHLDKHADMDSYAASKQRIYTDARHRVFNRADVFTRPEVAEGAVSFGPDAPSRECDWGVRMRGAGRDLVRGADPVCASDALALPGIHNELNALAACALSEQLIDVADMPAALGSFTGLAHRYQHVGEAAGVVYVNDSKATNLGATMAALAGMPSTNQVLLIAGGDAKGVDLSPLREVLPGRVRAMLALGVDGPQLMCIARSMSIDAYACDSIENAVDRAADLAATGETVLLSPACASLDMFASYAERGERFAAAVGRLGSNSPRDGSAT